MMRMALRYSSFSKASRTSGTRASAASTSALPGPSFVAGASRFSSTPPASMDRLRLARLPMLLTSSPFTRRRKSLRLRSRSSMPGAERGRVEVAQVARVQVLQVGAHGDERAAALGHLLAVDGEMAVHLHRVGPLEAGHLEHGGPEERVEVDDVLADEVDDAGVAALGPVVQGALRLARHLGPLLRGGDVPDGGVQPDVEVLVRLTRDGEAEVRPVAADVPVRQTLLEEALELRGETGVDEVGLAQRLLQEVRMARQLEEEVRGRAAHRRRAAQGAAGLDQVRGAVGLAALLTGVTVLVGSLAVGAGALDEAVRQEALVHLAVGLLDVALLDVAVLLQLAVDVLGVVLVLGRVGRVEVVDADAEVPEVRLVRLVPPGDELLGLDPLLGRVDLDGRAVGVVGAEVDDVLAAGAQEAHVDVGLDVLDGMADVDGAVGIRQRAGDEDSLRHGFS